ncbi:hypothetical protein MYCTH_2126876 [Thermothelomyces thermophilus ATCC 42464]|uniref:Uncharacterized protein n=1 Tax=Thermothelomyces thermophilus (strain ATCC 42464 / BCRC 31852 / DSM 1799) TaxID=573729 RepID=G2QBC8_THET4|nr:uncharacterized protein MYCTH_2126876 [Thermothelomyces thermophilus ATCC 42464]AEO57871.1 hypothetical protein MYCTH_2126876 [Thermothelomyces thermophilus ATCC 42464]
MAMTADNVDRLLTSPSAAAKSPDSDGSPGTVTPSVAADYFSANPRANGDSKLREPSRLFASASTDVSTTTLASISEEDHVEGSRHSSNNSSRPSVEQRKSSSTSVTFRPPRNPSLPQGHPRKTDNRRLRESSPSPVSREVQDVIPKGMVVPIPGAAASLSTLSPSFLWRRDLAGEVTALSAVQGIVRVRSRSKETERQPVMATHGTFGGMLEELERIMGGGLQSSGSLTT